MFNKYYIEKQKDKIQKKWENDQDYIYKIMERNLYIDASHPNETRVVLKSEENIEDYEYESKKNILVKSNI